MDFGNQVMHTIVGLTMEILPLLVSYLMQITMTESGNQIAYQKRHRHSLLMPPFNGLSIMTLKK